MNKTLIRTLLATLLLVGLAACDTSEAVEPPASVPGATEHEIWLTEMEFQPAVIQVPAGEPITLHLDNVGNMRHDLQLSNGSQSPMLTPGQSHTMEIGPLDETITGFCTVPGHVQAGMTFRIEVLP